MPWVSGAFLPAGAYRQGDTRPITFFEPGSLTESDGQAADVGINDGYANERRLTRYGAGLNAWGLHRQAVFAGRNETNPKPTYRIGLTGTLRAPEEGQLAQSATNAPTTGRSALSTTIPLTSNVGEVIIVKSSPSTIPLGRTLSN